MALSFVYSVHAVAALGCLCGCNTTCYSQQPTACLALHDFGCSTLASTQHSAPAGQAFTTNWEGWEAPAGPNASHCGLCISRKTLELYAHVCKPCILYQRLTPPLPHACHNGTGCAGSRRMSSPCRSSVPAAPLLDTGMGPTDLHRRCRVSSDAGPRAWFAKPAAAAFAATAQVVAAPAAARAEQQGNRSAA